MKFAANMVVSFITFFPYSPGSILYRCIYEYSCMFCTLLFNFVNYVFSCLCILIVMYYVPFWVFCFIVFFCVLFVCKCVLYYCHRVSTQMQLTNISYNHHYGAEQLLPFNSLSLQRVAIPQDCG